jgi:hypothetical protein
VKSLSILLSHLNSRTLVSFYIFSLSPRKVKFLPQHIGKPKDKVNDERFSSSAWEID